MPSHTDYCNIYFVVCFKYTRIIYCCLQDFKYEAYTAQPFQNTQHIRAIRKYCVCEGMTLSKLINDNNETTDPR